MYKPSILGILHGHPHVTYWTLWAGEVPSENGNNGSHGSIALGPVKGDIRGLSEAESEATLATKNTVIWLWEYHPTSPNIFPGKLIRNL